MLALHPGFTAVAIAVLALGITQITAWGTSYYCLGVLAKPIVAETGWGMGLKITWRGRSFCTPTSFRWR